jgi:hypothetical protein
MATASRSLATALLRARVASGLLPQSYTTPGDTTWTPLTDSLDVCGLTFKKPRMPGSKTRKVSTSLKAIPTTQRQAFTISDKKPLFRQNDA